MITLTSEHEVLGLREEGDGAGGTGWEASQKHRTSCRNLSYSSVPDTKVPEGKEPSSSGGSGRIK